MSALLLSLFMAAGIGPAAQTYVDDVFSAYTYTGNGGTQAINNGIDLAGKGGLVWVKKRATGTADHHLYDTARGATFQLLSNGTNGAITRATGLTSFNADGFTLGAYSEVNGLSTTNVAWTWAEAAKFFKKNTFSHTNGVATAIDLSTLGTVGQVHVKSTGVGDWLVWHRSLTAGNNLRLNTTSAQSTTDAWLSVSGTTLTISASAPSGSYVYHAWAHDTSSTGLIQCGSFVCDASGNATVNLGYEPQFIVSKLVNVASGWQVRDSARGFSHSANAMLNPNNSNAEASTAADFKPTATGFTVSGFVAGWEVAYMAIRRPNKPPTSGTQVYNAVARTGTGAAATVTGVGFAPDLVIDCDRQSVTVEPFKYWWDRLRGTRFLCSNNTNADNSAADDFAGFDAMDGFLVGPSLSARTNEAGRSYINWCLKRAPGVFDEVCWTTSGTLQTNRRIDHRTLGVPPELIISKSRSGTGHWWVYAQALGRSSNLILNSSGAAAAVANVWGASDPTATDFGADETYMFNANTTMVSYLFATKAGISKVGSYVGNGTTQVINCGFAAGARFVFIKRTDGAGHWNLFDTTRGIVAGNDPALKLNNTDAEGTGLDLIDPAPSGFEVGGTAPGVCNGAGETYIFFAVA
jgi:hypothetical protein